MNAWGTQGSLGELERTAPGRSLTLWLLTCRLLSYLIGRRMVASSSSLLEVTSSRIITRLLNWNSYLLLPICLWEIDNPRILGKRGAQSHRGWDRERGGQISTWKGKIPMEKLVGLRWGSVWVTVMYSKYGDLIWSMKI